MKMLDLEIHPIVEHGCQLTYNEFKAQVISKLDPDLSISEEDNLIDCGLDSIRIMWLMHEWREIGIELGFTEVVRRPTLDAWWNLISNN